VLQALILKFPAGDEAVSKSLGRLSRAAGAELEAWAGALLTGTGAADDAGLWPFIAAALQVVQTNRSSLDDVASLARYADGEDCPACGALPVASVLKSGGGVEGRRYLHCGLCGIEWRRPRIHCVHCGSGENVSYQSIEDAGACVKAETCDACHGYIKLIAQDKTPAADPFADDIATLGLDLLLNEAGYRRLGSNFFLMTVD
jgi:FdhE protein